MGRYVFVIHYYQPENPTFPVRIIVDGGRLWSGKLDFTMVSILMHSELLEIRFRLFVSFRFL